MPTISTDGLITEQPFLIGVTNPKDTFNGRWWCNQALAHKSGALPNERLLAMSDDDLRSVGFNGFGEPCVERYSRPTDKGVAERQGGIPGEEYTGVHRAVLILEYRRVAREEGRRL